MSGTLRYAASWFLYAAAWCAVRSFERKQWRWLCDADALWGRAQHARGLETRP